MHSNPLEAMKNAQLALELSSAILDLPSTAAACRMITNLSMMQTKYSDAIPYCERAIAIYREIGDRLSLSQLLGWLGVLNRKNGKIDKALENQQEALNVSREISSKHGELLALGNIGHIYFDTSNNDIALYYYLQAISLAEEVNEPAILHKQLNNLGTLYTRINDHEKALDYYSRSLVIRRELNDRLAIASSLGNIGEEYRHLGEYEKALEYQGQSLEIAQSEGNSSQVALALGNIGVIHESLGNQELSFEFHKKALEVIEPLTDKQNYTLMLTHMGKLFFQLKDYDNALETLVQALVFAEEYGGRDAQADIHKVLSEVYEDQGDPKSALHHFKLYNHISREVNHQAQQSSILLLEMRFSSQKAEKEKEELRRKLLQSEHKTLRAQINPHFMFNALNSIQHFLTKSDTEHANRFLSKFARLMRLIMENSRYTSVPLGDEIETISLYLELEKLRFGDKFTYDVIIDPSLPTTILIPPMLIQPYIENAIWHGILPRKSGGKVIVTITPSENEYIVCNIQDDGIGRKASSEKKDFEQNKHRSSGMALIDERLALLTETSGMKLWVEVEDMYNDSNQPTGTSVTLHLPQNLEL
ncbi:MAG: tetratricopeptide repeat protein [Ignavibacteria bacterium]|nr:tetratricopeptide repeat protein [Ignavibacteria bacterium]